MRNPFGRQPTVQSSKPLMATEYKYGGSSAINPDPRIFANSSREHPSRYDWAVDPMEMEDEDTQKKGVRHLVKKLNCGASKRQTDEFENVVSYGNSIRKEESKKSMWNWTSTQPTEPEITRPVLITVKDGETPSRGNRTDPLEANNSFVVGGSPARSRSNSGLFGFGSVKASKQRSSQRVSFQANKQRPTRSGNRDTNDVITAQERARRQRWRKGIERSWKDDADVPSLISGDESTYGCSVITGSLASATSGDSDYTTEDSSDASAAYSASRHAYRQRGTSRGPVRTSPPRRPDGQGLSRPAPDNSMWAGVAEDMGIIAGMLLSDGSACVGSVAAITHETVVDSCKPQGI